MNVSEAVASRRSVRAFLDAPVDLGLLRTLIEKAARAPSGGNLQPWHLHVVHGARLDALKTLMATRVATDPKGEGTEYPIYPLEMDAPYRDRAFGIGEALYTLLGVPREDRESRRKWFSRNYQFFGALIGLFCFVPRAHGAAQWSDCGMYLQTLMLLLREAGLDSCPQECWALYHRTISQFLSVPPDHMLFCGMSIGYADPDALPNSLVSPRAPAEEYLTFHG